MNGDEIHRAIKDYLEELSVSGPGPDRPRSEEEFRELWKVLREKARAEEQPSADVRRYDPDKRLESLQAKRKRLLIRQLEAHGARSTKKRDLDQMRRRLQTLDEEIAQLRSGEHPFYSLHRPQIVQSSPLSQTVTEARKDIDRMFRPTEQFVHWRLLPPSELSVYRMHGFYTELQARNPRIRYDLERIEKALALRPHQRYEEIDGVEGYVVFRFPYTSKALMECPKVGNAIYVIRSDWERWSKMSKQELMADDTNEVVRIPHQGDWFDKVKKELGFNGS